ncbi:MAG: CDP-alcohol phosphatidyltransferase family protein [Candidatus Levybacteria bacterium]|nr:CDP-alcohol phosphatidyltransferase family protein [Candidatus Levybacteria bacterium]
MLSHYKKPVEKVLEPLIEPLSKVDPNVLTVLGSIPPLVFFIAIITGNYILALFAFIGNLFDLIDGMVARKYKKVTPFGGFLDSTLDRVGDFLLITPFAFAGIVGWEIVAPLFLFAFLTSYIRSRGELANPSVSFAVGIIERTERLGIIFFSLLLYTSIPNTLIAGYNIMEISLLLLVVLSLYTVLQRVIYAYKKL